MAADFANTPANASADQNHGSVIENFQVASGATITAMDTVALDGGTASNGLPTCIQGDGNTATWIAALVVGICVGSQSWYGGTSYTVGQDIEVCVFGPTYGWTSLIPGALGYQSDNAGKVSDTVSSTHGFIVGQAQAVDMFFVNPHGTGSANY